MIDAALARQIVDDATDYAIFTLDGEGRITSWSPGAVRVFGYAAEEVVGTHFMFLFLEADRAADTPMIELAKALETGRAEDTRWHLHKSGDRFWANGVTMRLLDGPGLVKVLRDETASKLAEDRRVLLLNELNHRLKNTLVTVQSIVEQTLRATEVDSAIRNVLTERLIALSEAHDVLVQENWAGADLHTILRAAVALHEVTAHSRFTIDGPTVRLSPHQAVAMSLALHELATNAVKYGALSTPDGAVCITWNIAYDEVGGRIMTLLWKETGGPPVAPPRRRGFGTRLIERTFGGDGGRAELSYGVEGLACIISLVLTGADGAPILAVSGDPARPRQGS